MKNELWQPFHPEFQSNPYVFYSRIRKQAPIHQAITGEFILSRYNDVKNALLDDRFHAGNRRDWIEKGVAYLENKDYELHSLIIAMRSFLLMKNPPEHTTLRQFIASAWDYEGVLKRLHHDIFRIINENRGADIDFISDIARPITANVISNLLGLNVEEVKMLQSASLHLVKSMDAYSSLQDLVAMDKGASEFIDFFGRKIHNNEIKEGSVLHQMIIKNKAVGLLSDEELISTALFLFLAGTETTVASLANGVDFIISSNFDLKKVNNVDLFSKEIMRCFGSVHFLGRLTTEDVLFSESLIPKGSVITLLLASANRDEDYFPDGEQFNPNRTPNRHLAFGQGRHYCLGDKLAIAQIQIFWDHIIRERIGIVKLGETVFEKQLSIRGIKSLPVGLK